MLTAALVGSRAALLLVVERTLCGVLGGEAHLRGYEPDSLPSRVHTVADDVDVLRVGLG